MNNGQIFQIDLINLKLSSSFDPLTLILRISAYAIKHLKFNPFTHS